MSDISPLKTRVFVGASYGIVIWGAYAVVEVAFLTLRPLVAGHFQVVSATHWKFIGILFIAYLAGGLVCGGLGGFAVEAVSRRRARRGGQAPGNLFGEAAALTLLVAYLGNLVTGSWGSHIEGRIALVSSMLLVLALGLRIIWPSRLHTMAFLSDPWTLSLLLSVLPAAAAHSSLKPIAASLLLFAVASVVSRKLLTSAVREIRPPIRQLAALGVAVPLVLVSILLATRDLDVPIPVTARDPSETDRPNVIFVVLDTVRADHMSLNGYQRDTTPWMREFAKEATQYTRPVASSNFTLPTHASMFTGVYPRTHGATSAPEGALRPLAPEFRTLAESLSEVGYLSAALVANTVFVLPEFGLDQGFHLFDVRLLSPCLPRREGYDRSHFLRHGVRRLLSLVVSTLEFDQLFRRAEAINRDVFTLLDHAKRTRSPFFLFVNYMDAHDPYLPSPPFDSLFKGYSRRMTYERYLQTARRVVKQEGQISSQEKNHFVSQYDGAITYLDFHLQRLVQRLRELRLYDNTLIIITSDHGEAFGEHDLVGHDFSLYQHQLYVPLIIKYPGQRKGRKVDALVSHVDLMPTVLDAAGVEVPGDLHGASLLELKANGSRGIFAEEYTPAESLRLRRDYPRATWAIFSKNLKLIYSTAGQYELFNLSLDPEEVHNLYSADKHQSRQLAARLHQWLDSVSIDARAAEVKDPAVLDRLKALGYLK